MNYLPSQISVKINKMSKYIRPTRRRQGVTPKSVIVKAYAPNLSAGAARKRLSLWINTCKPLVKALEKTNYRKTQKYFSKAQIRLIYKYLDKP